MNEEVNDIQEGNVSVLFIGLDPVIYYRLRDIKDTRVTIKSRPSQISCKTISEWHPTPDNGKLLQVHNYTLINIKDCFPRTVKPYLHGTLAQPHHLKQCGGVTLPILLGHPIGSLAAGGSKVARLHRRFPRLFITRLVTTRDTVSLTMKVLESHYVPIMMGQRRRE